ncbi:MAG TPA: LptF/LptG family permease [Elusimicrobiota bacterium]|jgi:lipopolysaccharide export system permease protein|nr:LptF/LptG family permease [Elusimicrobiota bacterium]
MKVLTRYALSRFIGPFLFALGLFALLVFLGDLFDKMNKITASPAPAGIILQYLALQVPYWTVRVVPMGTLLATLFAVSSFVSGGEYVALQAAGIPAKAFFRPLWAAALLVSALSFAAQETVLPACYGRANALWHKRIFPQIEYDSYFDTVLVAGPRRLISVKRFSLKAAEMERPVMDVFEEGRIARQVDARGAHWDAAKGLWVFEDGAEREFSPMGRMRERSFHLLDSDLTLAPDKLEPRPEDPEAMTLRQVRAQMKRADLTGEPLAPLRTALQSKLAYPFTNLILCALGIPLALRLRRLGRGPTFAAALGVCFLYLWFIEAGASMGRAGRIPALAAAWVPNLIFGAAAVWMHRRAEI